MPNIADQVATIEHDLAAALATIDQLTAANSALVSANTSLQRDNVALQLEVNDMKHYVDDTRTMADSLAASALEMLRASRRHVGPAPIKAGAEVVSLDAKIAALPEKWPAQRAVAEIMAGDSGDEQPAPGFVAHDLYKTGDADAPDVIKDRNGEVVLGLCRKCGRGEIELADRCDTPLVRDDHVTIAPANKFEPLPIFLQRDTAFDASANVRPIFG
jgi:hypothetical protein